MGHQDVRLPGTFHIVELDWASHLIRPPRFAGAACESVHGGCAAKRSELDPLPGPPHPVGCVWDVRGEAGEAVDVWDGVGLRVDGGAVVIASDDDDGHP